LQERSQVRIRRRPHSSLLAAFFFAPMIRPFIHRMVPYVSWIAR
jgi:hypothetical protein